MGGLENIGDFRLDSVEREATQLSVRFETAQGPVGEETLRLDSLQATENVSQPFDIQLELRADDFSRARKLSIADFLGKPATAQIVLPDADTGLPSRNVRWFNGIVSQFTLAESGVYRASLKPALWRATLTNHYRVYQNLSIAETLKEVLDRHKVDYELQLGSVATSRIQDWLQAGETDMDFMNRLMEKANIYYYFVHDSDSHLMVLANRPSYRTLKRHVGNTLKPLTLRYTYGSLAPLAAQGDDLLTQYQYQQSYTTSGVDFLLARSRANWEPSEIDRARYSSSSHSSGNVMDLPFQEYKVYQYGGGNEEASELGEDSWNKITTTATGLSGSASSPLLAPGHVFSTEYDSTLQDSPEYSFEARAYESDERKVRENLEGMNFVVTQVQHKASATEAYSNSFQATEAEGLITPFNIQSTQQGTILAVVEASGGAVDPTDWRYLEKNNFYFETCSLQDREKPEQLNALGVYVRFITENMQQNDRKPVWVKLSQSMQTVPEAGVVVMVSRSNDESEVPEIQGIVQSFGSKVILPQRWSANTSVGSNYSTSYGDSKSVRYGLHSQADLPAAVAIVENAYAEGLYKDSSYSQGGSFSYSTAETGRGGLLSKSISYGTTDSEFYSDETRSYSDITYTWSKSLIGSSDSYSTVTGKSYSENIIGEQESHTTVTGNSLTTNKTIANSESYGFTLGNSFSSSMTVGSTVSVNGHVGLRNDTSLFIGGQSSMNTFIGMKTDMSIFVGGQNNLSMTLAANNTMTMNLSASNSLSLNMAENNSIALNMSLNNTVEMNLSSTNSLSLNIADTNSLSMSLAAKNALELNIADNNVLSLNLAMDNNISISSAMSNSINIHDALNNDININTGLNTSININDVLDLSVKDSPMEVNVDGSELQVVEESAMIKCRMGNIDVEMMSMKIFM